MKKGMFFALMVFAFLTVSISTDAQVQTKSATADTYKVVVNYSNPLDQMIQAGGYVVSDSRINTVNFPISGKGKVKVILSFVSLDKPATTDEIFAEMDKRGLRPATLPELLAFGAKYPEVQKQFFFAALGSIWLGESDRLHAAVLLTYRDMRLLALVDWKDHNWEKEWSFLAAVK